VYGRACDNGAKVLSSPQVNLGGTMVVASGKTVLKPQQGNMPGGYVVCRARLYFM
jgi:hypothetical protein